MAIDKTGSTENIDSYKRVREPLSPRKACFKRNIKTKNPVNSYFYRVFYVYIFLFRNPQNNCFPNILDLILDIMGINF
jgi:hypothetical protein